MPFTIFHFFFTFFAKRDKLQKIYFWITFFSRIENPSLSCVTTSKRKGDASKVSERKAALKVSLKGKKAVSTSEMKLIIKIIPYL